MTPLQALWYEAASRLLIEDEEKAQRLKDEKEAGDVDVEKPAPTQVP